MRRILLAVLGSLLSVAALLGAPCTQTATTLCLNDSRFEVEVSWRDSRGRTGVGQAVSITADTGYFWFFSEANIELVIKVLDARSINQKYWVFFGALSSVEYDLTVTDTSNGRSKTYHNPLGQFASVGDTGAFDPLASPAPGHETVAAQGTPTPPASSAAIQGFIDASVSKSAEAFTPCQSLASTLFLNGCRFGLSVDWTDSRGRTGRGVPVQLTNDTGYFWFFNDANVELVIKVLDARSINDNFWVFYGALSAVQYTMTVTDALTGEIRTYRNPSGTFASVGDTGAFPTGRTVTATADSGLSVEATIGKEGGSLSAAAADGTHFVLELPPGALDRDLPIRMTPLSRVDGLPFSHGLIGGVQLEPDGLLLGVPATLTIHPPSGLRPGAVGFSYLGEGEDFALDLSRTEAGEVRLQVLHFSGYGAGRATPGNLGTQAATVPASIIQAIRQQIAAIIERGREHEDENGNIIPAELTEVEVYEYITQLMIDAIYEHISPALDAVLPDCNRDAIKAAAGLALSTIKGIVFLGLDTDERIRVRLDGLVAQILHILETCMTKAHDDCVTYHDPLQAFTMMDIERQLQLFGVETAGLMAPGGPIEKCLRFEVQFDSTIEVPIDPTAGLYRIPVSAKAKLRIDPESARNVSWKGTGTTRIGDAFIDPISRQCTVSAFSTTESPFVVGKAIETVLFPLTTRYFNSTKYDLVFGYDPGDPKFSHQLRCETDDGDDLYFDYPSVGLWLGGYLSTHLFDYLGEGLGLVAERWNVYALPDIYARREYHQTGVSVTENTTILIRHTPDAP
jgi:hypothetical protein